MFPKCDYFILLNRHALYPRRGRQRCTSWHINVQPLYNVNPLFTIYVVVSLLPYTGHISRIRATTEKISKIRMKPSPSHPMPSSRTCNHSANAAPTIILKQFIYLHKHTTAHLFIPEGVGRGALRHVMPLYNVHPLFTNSRLHATTEKLFE
ncbi:hypothetical protein SFRURICE_005416 [Spodoptera frugiperda]|nr:hypothetical protein SFRURICE_005416 [Spodoptera frugiperda]